MNSAESSVEVQPSLTTSVACAGRGKGLGLYRVVTVSAKIKISVFTSDRFRQKLKTYDSRFRQNMFFTCKIPHVGALPPPRVRVRLPENHMGSKGPGVHMPTSQNFISKIVFFGLMQYLTIKENNNNKNDSKKLYILSVYIG